MQLRFTTYIGDGDSKAYPAVVAVVVQNEIMPIFQELSSEVLLKKCLHGRTQTNNEAINGFIWNRLPKDVFVGWYTLQIGVSSAVLNFNLGAHGLVDVFENLGMSAGFFTEEFCTHRDSSRIQKKGRCQPRGRVGCVCVYHSSVMTQTLCVVCVYHSSVMTQTLCGVCVPPQCYDTNVVCGVCVCVPLQCYDTNVVLKDEIDSTFRS